MFLSSMENSSQKNFINLILKLVVQSCSRGMYSAIEGRDRGTCVRAFEEFILRCKETWNPIIDGTCFFIMNLSSCYRLPLRKYYSNLPSLNCFVQTLFQGFLGVYIQDSGCRLCGVGRPACRRIGFAI